MMTSNTRPWQALGNPSPKSLSDTRLQLHWAVQVVGALANAVLEKRSDDSQDNLGWRDDLGAMTTHPLGPNKDLAAGLRLATGELLLVRGGESLWRHPIHGSSLEELRSTLRAEATEVGLKVDSPLSLRDYDMPVHAVQKGTAFNLNLAAAAELARWFANADGAMRRATQDQAHVTPLRCWPHHFDLGLLVQLDPDDDSESARSIGVGLSPGDGSYDEPYFYVSPYPSPDSEKLPKIDAPGHWHTEGFISRVLTATELLEAGGDQGAVADQYLQQALAAAHKILKG